VETGVFFLETLGVVFAPEVEVETGSEVTPRTSANWTQELHEFPPEDVPVCLLFLLALIGTRACPECTSKRLLDH
jgi:hypothetical protein